MTCTRLHQCGSQRAVLCTPPHCPADFQQTLLYLAIGTIFVKFSGRSLVDFWRTLDRLLLLVRVRVWVRVWVQVRFRVRFRWSGRYIYITVS